MAYNKPKTTGKNANTDQKLASSDVKATDAGYGVTHPIKTVDTSGNGSTTQVFEVLDALPGGYLAREAVNTDPLSALSATNFTEDQDINSGNVGIKEVQTITVGGTDDRTDSADLTVTYQILGDTEVSTTTFAIGGSSIIPATHALVAIEISSNLNAIDGLTVTHTGAVVTVTWDAEGAVPVLVFASERSTDTFDIVETTKGETSHADVANASDSFRIHAFRPVTV